MKLLPHSRFLPFLAPAVLVGVGVSFARQTNGPVATPTIVTSYEISAPANVGAIGRSVAGDFDGDLRQDFALVRDGSLEFVGAVGSHPWWDDSFSELGTVTDLTMLPAHGSEDTDTLVIVGSAGITLLSNFEQVDSGGYSAPSATVLSGSSWVDAKRVDARVVSGETGARILGVMSDGRSIRQRRFDSGTGAYSIDEAIALSPNLPSGEVITDFELVNFDGNSTGMPQLALATANGVFRYTLSGTTANLAWGTNNPAVTTTAIMRGKSAGSDAEWLAWATRDGNDNDWLRIVDISGIGSWITVPGKPGIVALAPISWDDSAIDSRTDLILSFSEIDEYWVAIQQSSGALFDMVEGNSTRHTLAFTPDSTYSGTANQAFPAGVDVDGDGDDDLVCPMRSVKATNSSGLGAILVALNGDVDESILKPLVYSNPAALNGTPFILAPNCSTQGDLEVQVPVELPTVGTHLRFAVWRKESQGDYTDPQAVVLEELTVAQVNALNGKVPIDLPDPDTIPGYTCGNENSVAVSNMYVMEIFLVTIDSQTQEVTETFPASVYGIETDTTVSNPSANPPVVNNEDFISDWQVSGASPLDIYWDSGNDPDPTVGSFTNVKVVFDTPPRQRVVSW